ncbi:FtsX-like permease family protein [Streptomyces sp. NPDC090106]|uniref:ABC transporter permease n=1 Tax=Streptomyces sp. NPDC090106 TaxID=3365946 RepID=UPI003802A46E
MLHLALHMARHRIATFLAVACAVLGGAALITTTGILAESGLRSSLPPGRLGGADIVVAADQEYHPEGDLAIALPERATVPSRLVARLAQLPGAAGAVGDIAFPAALVDASGRPLATTTDPAGTGHGWSSARLLPDAVVHGRAPEAADEIAVPAATALRAGDGVRAVLDGRPAADYRVTATVDAPDAGIYLADTTAARLAGRAPGHGPRAGTVDLIGVTAEPGARASLAAAVRDQVAGTGLRVLTGADRGEAVEPGVGSAQSLLVLLAGSLGGIVLLITGFVTAGALGLAVAGQRRELALMRAVAATPRQIRRLAAAQSTVVAALVLPPGILLGHLLADGFRDLLVDHGVLPDALPLTLSPLPALATVLLITGTVQLSARAAAWRTSRMPATEAVAESRSEPRTPSPGRTLTGVLLIVAACGLSAAPLLARTQLAASVTSMAGIVAAIGFALVGPVLVRALAGAATRTLGPGTKAPTWLALANVRAYAIRLAGVISPLAMAVVFTLTYVLAQTTLLAATDDDTRSGTLAQYRLTAPALGGLPEGTASAVRDVDGVRAAEPVGTTTVVWRYRLLGETETESSSATVLGPDAADVLAPGVEEGSLDRLTGATVAVSAETARRREARPGSGIRLVLGDGAQVTARVVATYTRALGFGPVILSADLAAGHTTTDTAAQSLLIRTDGTSATARRLSDLTAARSGLVLTDTAPGATDGTRTPPEVWINLAVVVVLLGYLLLSIANKLVAATAQRRTEIAALRLVGTTPRQVRAMMRREAAVTALTAVAAGALLSVPPLALLGLGLLDRPWPAGPAWLLPLAAVVIGLTSFLTVELPTRRALRLPPAEAVRAP